MLSENEFQFRHHDGDVTHEQRACFHKHFFLISIFKILFFLKTFMETAVIELTFPDLHQSLYARLRCFLLDLINS